VSPSATGPTDLRIASGGPATSSVSNVSSCAAPDWLETSTVMPPAPNVAGETRTRSWSIAAVIVIGSGGRGRFANLS
jgi:hypothetical protein